MKYLALLLLVVGCSLFQGKPAGEKVDPNERTLWDVCLPENPPDLVDIPEDVPPHTPHCPKPTKLKYKSLPIKVFAGGDHWTNKFLTRLAVMQWNEWLGFDLLQYVPGDAPGTEAANDYILVFVSALDTYYWGQAFPVWDGKAYKCAAGVFAINDEVGRTTLHEVGHCLGLSHDEDNLESVMKQGIKAPTYRLTAADRRAIRKLYKK